MGMTSLVLGGGRETKDSTIDLSVGIIIHKKLGDKVLAGDSLETLYSYDQDKVNRAKERLFGAFSIDTAKPAPHKYIYGIVSKDGLIHY